ncbi:lipoprotein-releasing ABC transporter permease subunit [Neisseria chenwenguii]|uniref:lipoprotein-releasing ABC transporter permease subunit n=1 Tax=Neisseria chenwenguii TaxID=1853278 RepID=UPI000F4FC08D|nr:lipoprotein-releasing ABC transporter permease subunit [Neisseria chenwenguii]ROV57415.1 lipoprotein-releasing ABC transporter permease subunit [Neisseria chenwenguii]
MASLETWIGLRYLRAKKRNGSISFVSVVSVIGIAVGVMALIVVLSVMNGFQKEIRGQLLNVSPHVEISFKDGETGQWQDLRKLVAGKKGVLDSAPFIAEQALLSNRNEVRGIQLRGILPEEEGKVVDYGRNMPVGSFNDLQAGSFNIVLAEGVAAAVGAQVGDKVTVISPEGNVTPAGVVPRVKQFTVTGVIRTGAATADELLALVNLSDIQRLYRVGDEGVGLRLKTADPQHLAPLLADLIPAVQKDKIQVHDWTEDHRSYFEAVVLEKRVMFIILTLIVTVAVFNLISSLAMTVNEKQSDIAILCTLGCSPSGIMKIFMVQGAVIGLLGTVLGVAAGVLLGQNIGTLVSAAENLAGGQLDSVRISLMSLPSEVSPREVTVIAGISLLLSFLATLYPSWRASKTQPAEALRYE